MIRKQSLASALTRRRFLELALASGSAAALRTGTASAEEPVSPKSGGILRVAHYSNPSSLDPITGRGGSEQIVLWTIFDTLIRFEPETLMPAPGLARTWSYPDPKTLVLDLEPGVMFHDGTPCDAAAVKANFDRMLENPRSTIKADIASIASAEVVNPARVALHLKYPDAALPLTLSDRAGMMASPDAFTKAGPDFDRNPVGSGPWRFVSWEDGNRVTVRRNDKYWQKGKPYLDGIDFRVIVDSNTGLRSVMAGENDLVYRVAAYQIAVAKRASNLNVVTGPTLWVDMVYFNFAHPPISDVRVRQAINYAIDRAAYTRTIFGDTGEVATGLLPSKHWAFSRDVAENYPYPYDPDKAKKLLAEAGFPDGCELLSLGYSDQANMRRMDILTQMLARVGIRLKQQNSTMATTNTKWQSGEGDFHLSAFTGRADPTLGYATIFSKDGAFNPAHVDPSPELSAAIEQSRANSDIAARKAAFESVQKLERQNALFVPLGFESEVLVHNNKVKGYVSNLIGKPRFDDVFLAG